MAEQPRATTGLAHLLSIEKMPKQPALRTDNWAIELEQWIRGLEYYLRRMFARFTASNILVTIINDEDVDSPFVQQLGLDRWVTIVPNRTGTLYLSNSDWRGRMGYFEVFAQPDMPWASTVLATVSTFMVDHQWNSTGLSDLDLEGGSFGGVGSFLLRLEHNTGKIKLEYDTTGAAVNCHFRIMMLATARKIVADETVA